MTRTAAEVLADFSMSTSHSGVPPEVREAIKLHLLDTIGCAVAAARAGAASESLATFSRLYPGGTSTIMGGSRRLPAPAAALVNGVQSHALEFDDTHPEAIVNVGAFVAPAALALAEARMVPGTELIAALATGFETTIRLGLAAAPSFLVSGFHPAAICGTFGATIAAARVLRASYAETLAALGIAGSLASGIYEHFSDGSPTKQLHAGWAAQAGVLAAELAQDGFRGPTTVLDGRFGVFQSHFRMGRSDLDPKLIDLGSRWEATSVSIKPYPICYMSLSAVDAVRQLVDAHSILPAEVDRIYVAIPEQGMPIVLEPFEEKVRPQSRVEAQFSLPYVIAAMIVDREVGLASFDAASLARPEVLELARRVVPFQRDFPAFPSAYPAFVRIQAVDGSSVTLEVDHEPGSAADPLSATEVREKFSKNVRDLLGASRTSEIEQKLLRLEDVTDVSEIMSLLQG